MANTFTVNTGGIVSLGNKTMMIGVTTFTDGAVGAVSTPFSDLNSAQFTVQSGAVIDEVTYSAGTVTVATASSGDSQHTILIGT